MQLSVPEINDLSTEPAHILKLYGADDAQNPDKAAFARNCILARRLIEKGVRFVQLYNGSWDSHDYIERAHGNLVAGVDQPIAALIKDLRSRGLLDSTLLVWAGEFGRTPKVQTESPWNGGRHHFGAVFSSLIAGGGFKGGHVIGASNATGEIFYQGKIDDPSMTQPLYIAAFPREDGTMAVAWQRPRRRNSQLGSSEYGESDMFPADDTGGDERGTEQAGDGLGDSTATPPGKRGRAKESAESSGIEHDRALPPLVEA